MRSGSAGSPGADTRWLGTRLPRFSAPRRATDPCLLAAGVCAHPQTMTMAVVAITHASKQPPPQTLNVRGCKADMSAALP